MKLKLITIVLLFSTCFFSCKKETTDQNNITPTPTNVTYSAMDITSVKINSMPFKNASNNNWDNIQPLDNPAPDIYFTFNDANTNYSAIYTSNTFWNVQPTQVPIVFTFTSYYTVPNFYGSYAITLYDDDSNVSLSDSHTGDDLVDGVNDLSPSNLVSQGYPASTTVISTDGKLSITLGLNWHN